MRKDKRRKHFLCLLFVIMLFITVPIVFLINDRAVGWKKFYALRKYRKLAESSISEISLRKTVDSAQWAVFSDDDLLQLWKSAFENLEVKRNKRVIRNTLKRVIRNIFFFVGGGPMIIEIKTETSQFFIELWQVSEEEYKLEVDGVLYDVKDSKCIPFEETYRTAIERHGITSPWD